MKLGFIGSSEISKFHLSALKNNNFTVEAIGTRKNSKNCLAFAEKNDLGKAFCSNGWEEVLDKNLDAYIICIDTKYNYEIIQKALETNKPILVEKPVDFELNNIEKLCQHRNSKNIFVGYNRRFYDSISKLKYLCDISDGGTVIANIPDSISGVKEFISNGSHIIDTLRYCLGDFEILNESVKINKSRNDLDSISALCENKKWNILLNAHSLIPSNFSITVNSDKNVYELKPIENLNIYEGMEIVEPTIEVPIRKYIPKLKESIFEKVEFKPGFDCMYKNFMKFIEKKECISCSIFDAQETLKVLRLMIETEISDNYLI